MTAYCLLDNLEITHPERLEQYKTLVGSIVRKYSGRYVVLGGQSELVEGTWKPNYPVMIEFPSLELAQGWYSSDDYRDLKAMRLSAGRFTRRDHRRPRCAAGLHGR